MFVISCGESAELGDGRMPSLDLRIQRVNPSVVSGSLLVLLVKDLAGVQNFQEGQQTLRGRAAEPPLKPLFGVRPFYLPPHLTPPSAQGLSPSMILSTYEAGPPTTNSSCFGPTPADSASAITLHTATDSLRSDGPVGVRPRKWEPGLDGLLVLLRLLQFFDRWIADASYCSTLTPLSCKLLGRYRTLRVTVAVDQRAVL